MRYSGALTDDRRSRRPNPNSRFRHVAAALFAAAGVLCVFQTEQHSFVATNDSQFSFPYDTSFPFMFFGLVAALFGAVIWWFRAKTSEILLDGLGVLMVTPLCLALIPMNIHGWTATFLFVGADATLIGVPLAVVAGVRGFIGYLRLKNMSRLKAMVSAMTA
jgi:peptidoglycan/LPS O-acetylase OafA/YrhL